ncbi:MAG: phosphonoacetaldehyde hydrolase [Thermodesulfobacteriota bacterium]
MEYRYQRRYQGPIKGVLLDLAGTVVDFGSCAPALAFVELFRRRGVKVTMAQAREPMGTHKLDHIRRLAARPEVAAQWRQAYGAELTEKDIRSLYEEFIPLQVEILPEHGRVFPGVPALIEAWRKRGIKIGVTTGYNQVMMDVVLKNMAAQGLVPDAVVSADQVARGRPAPWMIFRAMEALSVWPPEAVVNIGDTLPDVEAGLNAGVWSVGVVKTGNMVGLTREEMNARPPAELDHLLEQARTEMLRAGAHFVAEELADGGPVLARIEERLSQGRRP